MEEISRTKVNININKKNQTVQNLTINTDNPIKAVLFESKKSDTLNGVVNKEINAPISQVIFEKAKKTAETKNLEGSNLKIAAAQIDDTVKTHGIFNQDIVDKLEDLSKDIDSVL